MNRTRIAVAVVAVGSLVAASGLGPNLTRDPDAGPDDLKAQVQAADLEEAMALEALSAPAPDVPLPASGPCTEGFVGPYTCKNVDLASVVPLAELGGAAGNDSWGWTDDMDTPDDPSDDHEIVLMGTGTGVAFVDVTDPNIPYVLGRVQSEAGPGGGVLWRDVKVDGHYAFIVSEESGHGMQVFDLHRLRDHYDVPVSNPGNVFEPDAVNDSFGGAHNIAVNPESDTAYAIGSDVCDGGLHMIDISNPLESEVAGCFDADGYTHDVQCVNYSGPDTDHYDPEEGIQHEICFASNTDTVTIVDVTDKANPVQLARVGYSTAGYTHQGWLTPDQRFFVFNDETDEIGGNVDNTTTYVLDVQDLDIGDVPHGDQREDPLVTSYAHPTTSTDHNLYVTGPDEQRGGDLIWEANYNAGLRVLGYAGDGVKDADLTEVAYFDVDSEVDYNHYGDSWNVYPFFESGTVVVSNIAQGLIVLQPDYEGINAELEALDAS